MCRHDDDLGPARRPEARTATPTTASAAVALAADRTEPPFDTDTDTNADAVRAWLTATRPRDTPRAASESSSESPWQSAPEVTGATADRRSMLESLPELVDHASEADLFGDDRRVTLWFDRDPEGRTLGWHVTVELTGEAVESPDGHRLRLAGTWADASTLWSAECDPNGVEGLVVALARVGDDVEDTVARSLGALAPLVPGGIRRARGH